MSVWLNSQQAWGALFSITLWSDNYLQQNHFGYSTEKCLYFLQPTCPIDIFLPSVKTD